MGSKKSSNQSEENEFFTDAILTPTPEPESNSTADESTFSNGTVVDSPNDIPEGDAQELQLVDHILRTELTLIKNQTAANETENKNMTLVVVRNGSLIVGQPNSAENGENRTSNETEPKNEVNANQDGSGEFTNSTETEKAKSGINETEIFAGFNETTTFRPSTVNSTDVQSENDTNSATDRSDKGSAEKTERPEKTTTPFALTEDLETTTANISELLDRAVRRQFCKFPIPALDVTPRKFF